MSAQDTKLREYKEFIEIIAKVEYQKYSNSHLIELPELVNIGTHALYILFKNNNPEKFNNTYLSTAIKWAIRNELRSRYKWYGVRNSGEDEVKASGDVSYTSILSTDELFDSDKTYEIKDIRKNPEENCEFSMLSSTIKHAVMTLPKRERELIESKFFKEKKLNELSEEFSISPSRISRIIKAGLDKVKEELRRSEVI